MRVIVALSNRFIRTKNQNIYSTTVCDYGFWQRYLQAFDEVGVFGRVAQDSRESLEKPCANGQGVEFLCNTSYIGPWQYLKQRGKLNSLAKQIVRENDAFILRVPGVMASLLWRHIIKSGKPYGVEVVGDPWESLSPGSVKSVFRPIARLYGTLRQKQQCQHAAVAAYVSEQCLQKSYPSSCWSTNYSSIDLPDDVILNESELVSRFDRLDDIFVNNRTFNICHVGTMSAMYKAQDVLMEAVSICRADGLNVKLTLIGDGQYHDVFKKKAEELGIEQVVKFVGRIPPGQPVIDQLDQADMFILPSLTEGLPRSLIEAMARGLPCIATDVGGISELLDDSCLVAPANVPQLSGIIKLILTDKVRMKRMSLRNIKNAKKYCSSELNERRLQFFKKLIEEIDKYADNSYN